MNISEDHLTKLLKSKISQFDGICLASMDHSPSEQLSAAEWYTSVIIVSPGAEHALLANKIADILRPREKQLVKWNRASQHYKRNFLSALKSQLVSLPVLIFALSADKTAILTSAPSILKNFGLESSYHVVQTGKRRTAFFGPWFHPESGTEKHLEISENRALMALFIVHFLVRMHQALNKAAGKYIPWSMFMDKFPGDLDGDMETLFSCLLDIAVGDGQIMRGSFGLSDTAETDLLADNLAGLFSNMIQRGNSYLEFPDGQGFIYWEQYRGNAV